jgi:hypothetical protein
VRQLACVLSCASLLYHVAAAAATVATSTLPPQTCFRAAIQGGFTGVQILNHIDHDQGSWRNELDMNPTAQYEGFTYEDIVVRPAADALRTVTRPSTKVRIAQKSGASIGTAW